MRTRIKRCFCPRVNPHKKKLHYHAEVKVHWYSRWQELGHWWGNYQKHTIGEHTGMMFTDYRITTGSNNCDTKEEARKYIDDLKKQGYLYEPKGIWDVYPVFNDSFKGFFNE